MTIPAEVAGKNEREHRVYLTDTALELIGQGKGYIFSSGRGKRGHISENTLSQAINRGYLDENVVKVVGNRKIKARKEPYFGMKPWSPHDYMRIIDFIGGMTDSYATEMAKEMTGRSSPT